MGQATGKGVTAAAQLTAGAAIQAAKLAAPVGSWALKEGAKAAFKLITYAVSEGGKAKEQQQAQAKAKALPPPASPGKKAAKPTPKQAPQQRGGKR